MKPVKLQHKILASILAFTFVFQSMSQINWHTYTTGFANFHRYCSKGVTCCFGSIIHSTYQCGKTLHLY